MDDERIQSLIFKKPWKKIWGIVNNMNKKRHSKFRFTLWIKKIINRIKSEKGTIRSIIKKLQRETDLDKLIWSYNKNDHIFVSTRKDIGLILHEVTDSDKTYLGSYIMIYTSKKELGFISNRSIYSVIFRDFEDLAVSIRKQINRRQIRNNFFRQLSIEKESRKGANFLWKKINERSI
jgi:hypothetical protein